MRAPPAVLAYTRERFASHPRERKVSRKQGQDAKFQPRRSSIQMEDRLQKALFVLFLADRAVAGPRHRFQPLLLQLGFAVQAGPESIVADAVER